jgi:Ca2+-binding RTX toxin-like protein
MANLLGTLGDDLIFGDINGIAENDAILGREGNDRIEGGGGDDVIDGDDGSDFLDGGDGNDFIFGGREVDTIFGGAGNDQLIGGAGNDTIDGGAGNDLIYGDDINDFQIGANDTLSGGLGNDIIDAGLGSDSLDGGDGDDILLGGAGNDRVTGGFGSDFLSGGTVGSGSDTINSHATNVSGGTVERDEMYGGDGADTFNLRSDYIAGLASSTLVAGSGYAIIVDFKLSEGDRLNLLAPSTSYTIKYGNANDRFIGSGGVAADTFILRQGNVVAVVLDQTLTQANLGQVV